MNRPVVIAIPSSSSSWPPWSSSASRSPPRHAARPSASPVPRDRASATARPRRRRRRRRGRGAATGREVERVAAARAPQAGTDVGRSSRVGPGRRGRRPTPRPSASPAGSSSTAHRRRVRPRPRRRSAPRVLAFLWPPARRAASARRSRVGKVDDIKAEITDGDGLPLRTPRAACGSPSTRRRRSTRPRQVYSPPDARRHGGRARRALPEVPAPRLPRARAASPRSGSSARATARSTTGSARRRAARRPGASTASPSTVAGGVAHRRHRHDHPGPADRHQHHRPGGRGPALRRRRAATDGTARSTVLRQHRPVATVDRPSARSSPSSIVGVVVYVLVNIRAGQARGRLGDRAGRQPQAVLRRRGARGPEARPHASRSACSCLVVIAVGLPLLLAARAGPAGGRRRGLRADASSRRGERCSRPPTTRRPQLRRLPRRPRGRRRRGALHRHRRRTASSSRRSSWQAPALNTVLLPLQPRRGALHPHLRPAVLADAGVGRRPAAARSTTSRSRTSSTTSTSIQLDRRRDAAGGRGRARAAASSTMDGRRPRTAAPVVRQPRARPCSTSGYYDELRRRRLLLRPLPHHRAGPTASPRRRRRRRPRPDPRAAASSRRQFPTSSRHQQVDFVVRRAPRRASSYGQTGQGTGQHARLRLRPERRGRPPATDEVGVEPGRCRRPEHDRRHVVRASDVRAIVRYVSGLRPWTSSLAAMSLGPGHPRHPRRRRRRRRPDAARSTCSLATNTGARARLPHHPRRPLRLDDRSWASSGGSTASATQGRLADLARRGGQLQRPSTAGQAPRTPARCPLARTCPTPPSSSRATPSSSTQFPDDPDRASAELGDRRSVDPELADDARSTSVAETVDGWALLAVVRPPARRGRRPRPTPASVDGAGMFDAASELRRARRLRDRRQADAREDDSDCSDRAAVQARAHRHLAAQAPRRTTPSSRCSRSCRSETVPGEAAAHPRGRRDPAGHLGRHGARPRRPAAASRPCFFTIGSAHPVRRAAATIAAPPRTSVDRRRRRAAAWRRGADADGPVPARSSPCWSWPSSSRVVSLVASRLLAPQRPDRGQVGALRVRHRARAASRPSASRCASTWWR